jgi:hypothetical protein
MHNTRIPRDPNLDPLAWLAANYLGHGLTGLLLSDTPEPRLTASDHFDQLKVHSPRDVMTIAPGQRYDVIVTSDALHAVLPPDELLARFHFWLNDDGLLVLNEHRGREILPLLPKRFAILDLGDLDGTLDHVFVVATRH